MKKIIKVEGGYILVMCERNNIIIFPCDENGVVECDETGAIKADRVDKIQESFFEMLNANKEFAENKNWELVVRLGNNAILHNSCNDLSPYVYAHNYNAETNGWEAGDYCCTMEDAMINHIAIKRKSVLKDKYQKEVEAHGITFERMCELATLFKDKVEELLDDLNDCKEFFEEEAGMETNELDFFGIDTRRYKVVEFNLEKRIYSKVKIAIPCDESYPDPFDYIDEYDLEIDEEEDWDVARDVELHDNLSAEEVRNTYCDYELNNYTDFDY